MPLRLIKFALSREHPEPRMFTRHERLKPSYDVVIIGAGGHGCAAAYYLARDHGISDIAILEQGYLGGGNTGRNTTIIRSNYLTPEGVRFYDESVRLWDVTRRRTTAVLQGGRGWVSSVAFSSDGRRLAVIKLAPIKRDGRLHDDCGFISTAVLRRASGWPA